MLFPFLTSSSASSQCPFILQENKSHMWVILLHSISYFLYSFLQYNSQGAGLFWWPYTIVTRTACYRQVNVTFSSWGTKEQALKKSNDGAKKYCEPTLFWYRQTKRRKNKSLRASIPLLFLRCIEEYFVQDCAQQTKTLVEGSAKTNWPKWTPGGTLPQCFCFTDSGTTFYSSYSKSINSESHHLVWKLWHLLGSANSQKNLPFGVSLTVISLSNCQFFYYTLLKVTKKDEEERRKERSSLSSANCTKLGLESSSFSPCKNIGLPPKRRLYRLSS